VILESVDPELNGKEFLIEDYCENLIGRSWQDAGTNPAALKYALRNVRHNLPVDDNVVGGQINGRSNLVHESEIPLERKKPNRQGWVFAIISWLKRNKG